PLSSCCANAGIGAIAPTRVNAHAICLPIILVSQADVQRSRLPRPHLHLRDVSDVAALADVDGMPPLGEVDYEAIVRGRPLPGLTVDQNLRVGGLHANRERAVSGG